VFIDFVLSKFEEYREEEAIVFNNEVYNYDSLLTRYLHWKDYLLENIEQGAVVAVRADYSPDSVTLMLALIENLNVFVPLSYANKDVALKVEIAEVEYIIDFKNDEPEIEPTGNKAKHKLIIELRSKMKPGIIIFSSGSTGTPKAAIHDYSNLLHKFKQPRKALRTINFLLFDHWGGINTLLYIFSNGGLVGVPTERTAEEVCKFIQDYKIELLPTTPTFINLILMSKAYLLYDISSLRIVSYGTEAMPEATLKIFHRIFPKITLKQTYGLTELGVMRTKSKGSDSLWLKVGGEDYETKIKNDTLFIKSRCSIMGYLNAASPFDADGWYDTGDKVEQDGEWIKILGRDSDIINVGGQKVYPAEVESVLLQMENVKDVSVRGVKNTLMGSIVSARVVLYDQISIVDLKKSIRLHCRDKLEAYKIPAHIEIGQHQEVSERFKKVR
jgi:long-chain acyl-CoA synthetase